MMMRKLMISAIVALALLASGCWTLSIDPLYTTDTLVLQDGLPGIWGDPEDSTSGTWTFLPVEEETAYRLVIEEPGEPDAVFEAHLLRLGENLFMDLFPEEPESGNEFYVAHVIPAHSIWKISLQGHVLVVDVLDPDWLKKNVGEGEIDIKHLERSGAIVLTASTEELQEFVQEYADAAFTGEPLVMKRRH